MLTLISITSDVSCASVFERSLFMMYIGELQSAMSLFVELISGGCTSWKTRLSEGAQICTLLCVRVRERVRACVLVRAYLRAHAKIEIE